MWVTDAQVKRMKKELSQQDNLTRAAMLADMDRKTARRYRDLNQLPSQLQNTERSWRTRTDPFDAVWPDIEQKLKEAPGLEAKSLFEDLCQKHPDTFTLGQLRTLQRKVKRWRAEQGPPKEVFFPQEHRPAEATQADFTNCNELNVTIAGVPFPHLLCHCVLPYSRFEWVTLCHGESIAALIQGAQAFFIELGGLTEVFQTDNSTSATHNGSEGGRLFNEEYLRWTKHVGIQPRTTAIGEKEQNGSVEALNGSIKRRIEQHLLLRNSRDFESVAHYLAFLHGILRKTNATRKDALQKERELLKPLPSSWWPDYKEQDVTVTSFSTIRVAHNTYSVPSRLIGESVRIRLYDDKLDIYYAGQLQLTIERMRGRFGHRIDYRHIVWSLVQKPGAFARYRYQEDLFPSLLFRRAYDTLTKQRSQRHADLEYIRLLHLAASTCEHDVSLALELALSSEQPLSLELVRSLVKPHTPTTPLLNIGQPDVSSYDQLLERMR